MRGVLLLALLGVLACGARGVLESYDEDVVTGAAGGAPSPTNASVTTSSTGTAVTSITASSVGPSTVVSTATGPNACDHTGDCPSCFGCSSNEGSCAALWATCLQTPGCAAIVDCIGTCNGDPFQCFQACSASSPGGQEMLEKAIVCTFCNECMNDCDGFLPELCG